MGANKKAAKGSNAGKVGGFKDIMGGSTGGISDLTGKLIQPGGIMRRFCIR